MHSDAQGRAGIHEELVFVDFIQGVIKSGPVLFEKSIEFRKILARLKQLLIGLNQFFS